MDPRRRLIAAAGVAAVLAGACSGSRSADDTMPPLETTSDTSTASDDITGTPAPTTTSPDSTSAPSSSSNATTTTPEPVAAVTTTVPATSGPTATAEEPDDDAGTGDLVLRPDGIGDVAIGEEAGTVIETLEEQLGPADDDTGWEDPLASVSCTQGEFRRVTWGSLSLLFTDDSGEIQGPRHLFGYEYGIVGQPGAEPEGLATEEGLGIGTTVAALRQAYPDADVDPGEDGFLSPFFYVTDGLQGLLSGADDNDEVTLIIGGTACGL